MLDTATKRRIDTARDILVGKVPDPKSQVEQITIALIYKFMDDMDAEAEELGGKRKFFSGDFARFGWARLMSAGLGGHEMLGLYSDGISKMPENPGIPLLFRDIFKNAYLPYRDPETLKAFLKIINEFSYDHSERLGDAFEYLLSVLGSQGDAGQFRTPRHIIDFIVAILDPQKHETILDPACGTAGFLISAWKHILRANTSKPNPSPPAPLPEVEGSGHYRGGFDFSGLKKRARELRQTQTDAEKLLWELLRDRQLGGAKFRRQHQFGDYICDFFCSEAKLVVECDGPIHHTEERRKLDQKRDAYLKSQGLAILRLQNDRILSDPTVVLNEIAASIPLPSTLGNPLPSTFGNPLPSTFGNPLPSTFGRGAGGEGVGPRDLTPDERGQLAKNIKGYDISPDMVRLSLVNLYLHGFNDPHIYEYDTLTSEERWNEFADVILANPPFMSPKGGIKPHRRFSIQAKRSEVLFVDYMAEHLTPTGRAGIIVPEGIIFQSQTAYKELRKLLVTNSLVAVVSLPSGCFNPYSGVKTSILILDKSLAKQSDTVAFFKVENDGFGLGAQRRAIEKNDLPQVQAELAAYLHALRTKSSIESILSLTSTAQIVPKEKIAANGDYNLSGERYREGGASHSEFPHVTLIEVCEINPDTANPAELFPRSYFNYIDISCVENESGKFLGPNRIATDEAPSRARRSVHDGDVLISTVRPNLKAFALLTQVPERAIASTGFAVLRAKSDRLLPGFLINVLRDNRSVAQMIGMSGRGAYPSINQTDVESLEIPLPPLEMQKEIVAEIEGYQKVINGARIVLDHYRPHIPIHPDWPIVPLEEACDIQRGKFSHRPRNEPRFYGGKYPFIQTGDVVRAANGEKITFTQTLNEEGLSVSKLFKPPVVVITIAANIGDTAVLDFPSCFPDSVVGLIPKPETDARYLEVIMRTKKQHLNEVAPQAAQKNINIEILKTVEISLPPLASQQAIVAEIKAEQALVAANRELITRFEQKIQATLARIWGEDEPDVLESAVKVSSEPSLCSA